MNKEKKNQDQRVEVVGNVVEVITGDDIDEMAEEIATEKAEARLKKKQDRKIGRQKKREANKIRKEFFKPIKKSKEKLSAEQVIENTKLFVNIHSHSNGKNKVSNKEELYLDPDIEKIEMSSPYDGGTLRLRAYNGFIVACHFFAFISEKEDYYDSGWALENKRAVNMLCRELDLAEMYPDIVEDTLTWSDFGLEAPAIRPLLTKNIINEAMKRFPVTDEQVAAMKSYEDGVDVYKIEEQVIEAEEEKKKSSKKEKSKKKEEKSAEKVSEEMKQEQGFDPEKKAEEAKVEEPKKEEAPKQEEEKPKEEEKVEEKKEEEKRPEPEHVEGEVVKEEPKKDDKVEPIFDFSKMDLVNEDKEKRVTETQKKIFNEAFGEFMNGREYQLNKTMNGAIECVITNPTLNGNIYTSYWIDPNICIGNGYNVLARITDGGTQADTIPVHHTEKEICAKVFANREYVLTPDEIQKCMSHMFLNQKIYSIVDMSGMKKHIGKMSAQDFDKLGKKLTYIINSLNEQTYGRFRFAKFKNINNFVLVSDKKTVSPFPGDTEIAVSGAMVTVSGDQVTITHGGNSTSSTIVYNGIC